MRKTVRSPFVGVLLILLASTVGLAGCGDAPPAAPQPTATTPSTSVSAVQEPKPTPDRQLGGVLVPPTGIETAEVPETVSYRDAIIKGLGTITWVNPGDGEAVKDSDSAQQTAHDAIKSEGTRLAEVDYVALSLPDFKEITGKLELSRDDFQGGEVVLEAIGRENDAHRYLLFSYTGKEIPQHPERPLVFRWVQAYALYDNTTSTVVRLVATIRGEVHE
jgi:hypothetical protein